MGFLDAVKLCLGQKYFVFSGRAARSEFWWFTLFWYIIPFLFFALLLMLGSFASIASGNVDGVFAGGVGIVLIIFGLFMLALIPPLISVTVRRFHDVDLSGWWLLGCFLGGFIPIVGFFLTLAPYIVGLIKGTTGDNKYGPDPLAEHSPADVFA